MEVGVLGPLQVRENSHALALGTPQQQLVLALLAVRVGEPVSLDELALELWGERPPASAVAKVRGYAAALRRLFASVAPEIYRIVRSGSGYVLEADNSVVDLIQFEHQLGRARAHTARQPETAAHHFERALGLWRGVMLDGLPRGPVLAGRCAIVEQDRLAAVDSLAELHMSLGDPVRASALLLQQVVAEPLREQSHALLMRARYQTDGVAAALRVYDSIRGALTEQLGVEPGSELQRLHRAVLNRDTSLDRAPQPPVPPAKPEPDLRPDPEPEPHPWPAPPEDVPAPPEEGPAPPEDVPPAPVPPVRFAPAAPAALPRGRVHFTGRDGDVALLRELLTRPGRAGPAVVLVTGPGGVGKTTLCLHAGHAVRDAFPDGQLFMELPGAGPDQQPTRFAVLGTFLRLLGVDGAAMPDRVDERAALYRELLAGRRVLVVLDNLAGEEQLRELLPDGPGCGVIANSRSWTGGSLRLPEVTLDVLGPDEAVRVLTPYAGPERAEAESGELAELATLCDRLPLALRLAGGRLTAEPKLSVGQLVAQLRDQHARLRRRHPDRATSASLPLAYQGLTGEAQRLFRRIGDLGVGQVTGWIAAGLLGTPIAAAGEPLNHLLAAQLLQVAEWGRSGPARLRAHPLVQTFAAERAVHDDTPHRLAAARQRTFEGCLFLLETGYRSICGRDHLTARGTAARCRPAGPLPASLLADPLRWCDRELPTIVALVRRAAADGQTTHCWELAVRAALLLQLSGDADGQSELLETALAATRGAGDRAGEAAVLTRTGCRYTDRAEHEPARQCFRTAIELFAQVGDRRSQAIATALLGMVARFGGAHQQALAHYHAAFRTLHELADDSGASFALRGIGQVHLERREYVSAERYFAKARARSRRAGSRLCLAQVSYSQGLLRLEQARYVEAEARFLEAFGIARAIGYRPGQAYCLHSLGRSYQRQGALGRAREVLTEALELANQPRPTDLTTRIRGTLMALDTLPARHSPWA